MWLGTGTAFGPRQLGRQRSLWHAALPRARRPAPCSPPCPVLANPDADDCPSSPACGTEHPAPAAQLPTGLMPLANGLSLPHAAEQITRRLRRTTTLSSSCKASPELLWSSFWVSSPVHALVPWSLPKPHRCPTRTSLARANVPYPQVHNHARPLSAAKHTTSAPCISCLYPPLLHKPPAIRGGHPCLPCR